MIHTGDCVTVMATMPSDSIDAIVTDPPYGLEFMGKEWDTFGTGRKGNPMDPHGQTFTAGGSIPLGPTPTFGRQKMPKCGTCGKWKYNASKSSQCACDNPVWIVDTWSYPRKFQEWCEIWARAAWRVTKPGGYLLAFGGTRTHHRLVCGLEDAGWIIRDELDWIYASGFPKGKANLKPAHEPIVLARKPGPLRPLGIDETRIGYVSEADTPTQEEWNRAGSSGKPGANGYAGQFSKGMKDAYAEGKIPVPSGRWPSNVLLSDPELFDEPNPYVVGSGATAGSFYDGPRKTQVERFTGNAYNGGKPGGVPTAATGYGDSGGYSRFFIISKADRADREPVLRGQVTSGERGYGGGKGVKIRECRVCGDRTQSDERPYQPACMHGDWEWKDALPIARENAHPTVKPTDLMRHLVRLVTPSGGTVLDPFLGSGSTAIACELEGFPWIGIEKEPEYVAIAEARLNGTQRGMGLVG